MFKPEVWGMLDIPRHIYHFTPESLEILLKNLGFKIVKKYYKPVYPAVIKTSRLLKYYLIIKAYFLWCKDRTISDAFTFVVTHKRD